MSDSNLQETPPPLEAHALRYAGFWRRFGAFWLDTIALLPLMFLSIWVANQTRLGTAYLLVPNLILEFWFSIYLVKRFGGTPGKLLLKIKIRKLDGSPAGYREAILRHSVDFVLNALSGIALIISALSISDAEYLHLTFQARGARLVELAPAWYHPISTLGTLWLWSEFIVMLTNKRRRALHDFVASTIVISTTSHSPGPSIISGITTSISGFLQSLKLGLRLIEDKFTDSK